MTASTGVLDLVHHLPGAVESPMDNTDSAEEKRDDDVESEIANAPEQGGPIEVIEEENAENIEEGHLFVSAESLNQNYESTIRELLNSNLCTESNPLEIEYERQDSNKQHHYTM